MNMKSKGKFDSMSNGVSLKSQQGIATILVVILMGVSMTAMALGLVFSLKGSQEKQVAIHASTHSQVGLWSGVEAFRRYLGAISVETLESVGGVTQFNINMGAGYGRVTAKDITVAPNGALYNVAATLVNTHDDSQSSSSVGVMFEIDPNTNGGGRGQNPAAVINFYDSLELAGQVTFNLLNGVGARINVEGDVMMANVNASNLDQINATGSVAIGSGVQLDKIHSGGDVVLTGSAHANTVLSEGRVETANGSGAGADLIWANKAVTLYSSQRSERVSSLETITVYSGSHGKFNALGDVIFKDVGTIDEVETQSDVNVVDPADSVILTSVIAEGSVNCPSGSWGNIVSLAINGTADGDCGTWPLTATDAGVSVAVMNPVTPFSMPPVIVDVWTLKDKANYVFEYDDVLLQTKVTLNNINGVADGSVFYIGNYSDDHKSYLCTSVDSNGDCTAPSTPGMAICLGHSTWNECVSYGRIDSGDATSSMGWTFDGVSAAPGIMWFDGGVNLNNGVNYTTILATENVITGGQLELYSVNYGGYDGVCLASGSALAGNTVYQTMFQDQYPTNLCDKTLVEYKPTQTGNIGIASGGYTGDPAVFSGGIVELGTSNQIFGVVLAGHTLNTGGQTRVHGYVTAAAQAGKVSAGSIANTLGANSTIDLTTSVSTYDATDIPVMGVPPTPATPSGPAIGDFKERSRVLWSRYL